MWFRACVGGDRGAKNCCVAVNIFLGDRFLCCCERLLDVMGVL